MPNIEESWLLTHPTEELSAGGAKVLRRFTQYPIRTLEQAIHTHYRPFLNPSNQPILYFNFPFSSLDMDLPSREFIRFQALGSDQITVLAEASSYSELGKYIGISNVTARNNMD